MYSHTEDSKIPNIGDLVKARIVSIIEDRVIVINQYFSGFVIKQHLDNDPMIGSLMIECIKIGDIFP